PSTIGASACSTTWHTASVAPYAKHSPQPVTPSSVTARTRICLPAPAAHDEGGPETWSGTASGIARISVIFISEVAEPQLFPAVAHPGLVLGGRAHRRREPLAAPLGTPLELPGARRVDQHAIPQTGAEPRAVA